MRLHAHSGTQARGRAAKFARWIRASVQRNRYDAGTDDDRDGQQRLEIGLDEEPAVCARLRLFVVVRLGVLDVGLLVCSQSISQDSDAKFRPTKICRTRSALLD